MKKRFQLFHDVEIVRLCRSNIFFWHADSWLLSLREALLVTSLLIDSKNGVLSVKIQESGHNVRSIFAHVLDGFLTGLEKGVKSCWNLLFQFGNKAE